MNKIKYYKYCFRKIIWIFLAFFILTGLISVFQSASGCGVFEDAEYIIILPANTKSSDFEIIIQDENTTDCLEYPFYNYKGSPLKFDANSSASVRHVHSGIDYDWFERRLFWSFVIYTSTSREYYICIKNNNNIISRISYSSLRNNSSDLNQKVLFSKDEIQYLSDHGVDIDKKIINKREYRIIASSYSTEH